MTDETGEIIAMNLEKIMAMSPEDQEKFAKAELDVTITKMFDMDPAKRVEFLYDLISDRLNRVYLFGYNNGFNDGYNHCERVHNGILN